MFHFLFSVFVLAGCGAPGEPTPPSPPVPAPVSDLSARQSGDGVQLRFTVPSRTVSGDRLIEPPAVEILRGGLKPDGSPDNKSFRVVYTIPGALVDTYAADNHLQFTDPLSARDLQAHPGWTLAYRVQTRVSKKRASAESNTVSVRVFPVPGRISSVEARVTESAIELSWPVPANTSAGTPLQGISVYHIYRGEIDPGSIGAASQDLSQAKWISPLALLAPSPVNSYRDTLFDFGKTYVYVIRSVIIAEGNPLESDDSVPAFVTARDTFPPAAPQNLAGAVVPTSSGSPTVELSWSINLETDLAGYRVYRSEQQDTPGRLLTPDLLPTPAYRDMSVAPGRLYWYTVTAVDRAGNESAPSSPAAVDLTQPLQ
jgi:hypothetical protein